MLLHYFFIEKPRFSNKSLSRTMTIKMSYYPDYVQHNTMNNYRKQLVKNASLDTRVSTAVSRKGDNRQQQLANANIRMFNK
jgi:hypothetical protein